LKFYYFVGILDFGILFFEILVFGILFFGILFFGILLFGITEGPGSVAIEVETEEVEYFIVHASSILNVTGSRGFRNNADGKSTEELQIVKTFRYKPNDFWIIQLAQTVNMNTFF
jgi:hypothetical protein